jgi:hypothetical protein
MFDGVDKLPVQVGQLYHIVIEDLDRSHAEKEKIVQDGGGCPSDPQDRHMEPLEFELILL